MVEEVTEEADTVVVDFMGDSAAPMEAVLVAIALGMASPVMATEVAITVVDGMEEVITGEDVASIPITHTEDLAIPTSAITPITIPIMRTGIGLRGVILGGGVIGFECHTIIEGEAPTNRLGGISCDSALCASSGVYYDL